VSLKTVPPRERNQAKTMLRKWEFVIKQVGSLSKKQLIDAKPELKNGIKYKVTPQNVLPEYRRSVKWLYYFGYNPKNISSHFDAFFS
jgi:hypothetical protein